MSGSIFNYFTSVISVPWQNNYVLSNDILRYHTTCLCLAHFQLHYCVLLFTAEKLLN